MVRIGLVISARALKLSGATDEQKCRGFSAKISTSLVLESLTKLRPIPRRASGASAHAVSGAFYCRT
jgi:hypothetical protein